MITSNNNFKTAVRYALDYPSIVSVAGPGAIQAPGIIPSMFLGSLPQKDKVVRDLTKAKAALAASGVGGQSVTLEYPSDLTLNGVPFTTLAQKVQANLQAAGINVTLSGSPKWLAGCDEGGGIATELPPAALLAHHDVRDPHAEAARDDDRRFVGEGHPGLERRRILSGDERPLVDVHPDPVPHAVAEML